MVNEMEIHIWPKIEHRNILKLVETSEDIDGVVVFFTDLMETNLFLRLQNHAFRASPNALGRCQTYIKQVFSGISYLHLQNLCHLDLRAENIFLALEDDRAVVADFSGLSWSDVQRQYVPLPRSLRPPEMLGNAKQKVSTMPVDLWTCGLLMASVFFGKAFYIFTVKHAKAGQPAAVKQYTSVFRNEVYVKKFVSETFKPSFFTDGTISRFINLIQRFLRTNPNSRINVVDALDHPFLGIPLPLRMEPVNGLGMIARLDSAAVLQGRIDECNLATAGESERFQVTTSRSDSKVITNPKKKPVAQQEDAKPSRWTRYKIRLMRIGKKNAKPKPILKIIGFKNEDKRKAEQITKSDKN